MGEEMIRSEQLQRVVLREDIGRLKDEDKIAILFRLGRAHDIISYNGINYVMTKFSLPLCRNIENMLKHRLPSLPRYFSSIQKAQELYLIRKYETTKLKTALEAQPLIGQIFLVNSLVLIMQELHRRDIFLGDNFVERTFVDGLRIIVEPGESGSKGEDSCKLVLLVREWVKNMREGEIKDELEKINDPQEMLPIFDSYIS